MQRIHFRLFLGKKKQRKGKGDQKEKEKIEKKESRVKAKLQDRKVKKSEEETEKRLSDFVQTMAFTLSEGSNLQRNVLLLS